MGLLEWCVLRAKGRSAESNLVVTWATDFCSVGKKNTCVSSCCRVGYVLTCLQYDISCLESKSRYINYASIWRLIYVIHITKWIKTNGSKATIIDIFLSWALLKFMVFSHMTLWRIVGLRTPDPRINSKKLFSKPQLYLNKHQSTIYIYLPRLHFRWVKDGKRITLKHSEKHHFRTKPFLDSFRTRSETSLQNTAVKHDIRFTDRRSTLKGLPKRCLYQKTTPMRNLLLTSCIPL